MTDIHAIISKATSDLIDLTGYEKAVDIQSVLYMNLSGYTLEEERTEVAEAGDKLAEAVESWMIELGLQGCTESTIRTYAYNLRSFLADVPKYQDAPRKRKNGKNECPLHKKVVRRNI